MNIQDMGRYEVKVTMSRPRAARAFGRPAMHGCQPVTADSPLAAVEAVKDSAVASMRETYGYDRFRILAWTTDWQGNTVKRIHVPAM